MKTTFIIICIVAIGAIAMISTKPSDAECISQVRYGSSTDDLDGILTMVTTNKYTVKVEDHIFYKQIYSFTGRRLGTGIFGTVIISE